MSKFAIHTARLRLRPILSSDLGLIHQIWTDPVVRFYLWDNEIISKSQVEEILQLNAHYFDVKGFGLWFIEKKEAAIPIGFTGLWYFFDEKQPQLIYGLLPAFHKKGFATEAAKAIIAYAFDELDWNFLDASCDLPNQASIDVARRIGMAPLRKDQKEAKTTLFFRIRRPLS